MKLYLKNERFTRTHEKQNFYYSRFVLKMNPAPITHKEGSKIKTSTNLSN
jgi:hypothetical protein